MRLSICIFIIIMAFQGCILLKRNIIIDYNYSHHYIISGIVASGSFAFDRKFKFFIDSDTVTTDSTGRFIYDYYGFGGTGPDFLRNPYTPGIHPPRKYINFKFVGRICGVDTTFNVKTKWWKYFERPYKKGVLPVRYMTIQL